MAELSVLANDSDSTKKSNVGNSLPKLIIDVHTHILPRDIPKFKEKFGYGGFIQLDHFNNGNGNGSCTCGARMMRDDGTFFRDIEANCWDADARLQEMEENTAFVHKAKDIHHVQVLSTVPVMFSYWTKPEDCLEICHCLNDHIAEIIHKHPTRFVGLGTVPLQDIPLAIQELERCKQIGLKGVEIGTNVNQMNLYESQFLPFFAKCEELNMSVFIHPWEMMGEKQMGKYWLPWLVGMPAETTRAICALLFSGIFTQFPTLRVLFAHGGGSFPGTFPRIEHGYHVRPDLVAIDNPLPPSDYIGLFWVDNLVHNARTLDFLVDFFGPEKVALGSDYPFPLGELHPGELIASMTHWNEHKKDQLYCQAALQWLDMKESDFLPLSQ